jgi:hypothetical protein
MLALAAASFAFIRSQVCSETEMSHSQLRGVEFKIADRHCDVRQTA